MPIPDTLQHPGLNDLRMRADSECVQIWLAERGFVAVDRVLMEELIRACGERCGAVYHADGDYYLKREKAA